MRLEFDLVLPFSGDEDEDEDREMAEEADADNEEYFAAGLESDDADDAQTEEKHAEDKDNHSFSHNLPDTDPPYKRGPPVPGCP